MELKQYLKKLNDLSNLLLDKLTCFKVEVLRDKQSLISGFEQLGLEYSAEETKQYDNLLDSISAYEQTIYSTCNYLSDVFLKNASNYDSIQIHIENMCLEIEEKGKHFTDEIEERFQYHYSPIRELSMQYLDVLYDFANQLQQEFQLQCNCAEPFSASTGNDDILFRVAAPAFLETDYYTDVKVMMFNEENEYLAQKLIDEFNQKVTTSTSGIVHVDTGETVHIALQSKDIELEDSLKELNWNGRFAACSFEIYIPHNYTRKQVRINARVYLNETILTDLKIYLNVAHEPNVPHDIQAAQVELCRINSAYISYSSADREKVSARIQGMLCTRPDLDLFFDILSLRRGEYWEERFYKEIDKRDLLYLFWSRNAAKSEWVAKELHYALETKGENFVEPIPLEPADVCPPPAELQNRHCNDWLLYIKEERK